mmetsp:Transcript_12541/g.21114  ORF Transcript_12541/g.21114 Transcript_12541/m.21114 type:complete len:408 (-) Transcript_12541:644-1867(-)
MSLKIFKEFSQGDRNKGSTAKTFSLEDVLGLGKQKQLDSIFQIVSRTCLGDSCSIGLTGYVQIKKKVRVVDQRRQTMIQIIDFSQKILCEKANARNELLSLINATVSHEMRNPLNSIVNQNLHLANTLALLGDKATQIDQLFARIARQESVEEVQKLVAAQTLTAELRLIGGDLKKVCKIQSASAKILRFLVNDMLDFARLKQDKFVKEVKTFDIREAVQEIVEIQQYQADRLGIALETEFRNFEACAFLVTTDAQRLQQVVLNLVSNALKFTRRGSIAIKSQLVFNERKAKWSLMVCVKDTGIGIKQADQAKLFRLFGTLSSTSQQNSQGIGLGLVICQDIVSKFGGAFEVKSKWRKGTKFVFGFDLEGLQANHPRPGPGPDLDLDPRGLFYDSLDEQEPEQREED